ncbi:hypothetical protein HDV05_004318 [Chytridiales sp. JEL 0842]|nr:hypothetical protein HDV05_004318 [Chytridiales sp. JEL 0842]
MDIASRNGHLDIVQYLHHRRSEGCTVSAMDLAAANRHLDVLQFLHENRKEGLTNLALNMACANGHLDIVRYICTITQEDKQKQVNPTLAFEWSLTGGHVDVAKYLVEAFGEGVNVDELSAGIVADVASRGNWEGFEFLLEFLNTQGGTINMPSETTLTKMTNFAANTKFLNASSLNKAIEKACTSGHLDMLTHLLILTPQNYTLPPSTFDAAASYGHLHIVEYLNTHPKASSGCTPQALQKAIENGHLDVVLFLHANRNEGCNEDVLMRLIHDSRGSSVSEDKLEMLSSS